MKRLAPLAVLSAALTVSLAAFLAPAPASAAVSGFRGIVVDEQGQPVVDVDVEIQALGGLKRTYHVKTNKKGGFARIGLDEGSYKIFLTKEGYQKGGLDVPWLSLGGLSDLCSNNPGPNQPCEPLVLKKAEVAIAIGGAPAGATAGGAAERGAPEPRRRAGRPRPRPRRRRSSGPRTPRPSRRSRPGSGTPRRRRSRRSWRRCPTNPWSLFNLGHVYRQKKDYPAAEAEFRKVTELEPTKPEAFIAMAALYEAEGKGGTRWTSSSRTPPASSRTRDTRSPLARRP